MKKYAAIGIIGVWALFCFPYLGYSQQDYPTKPVSIMHGFAVAGSTDLVVRMLGEELTKVLGQPVITVPKPGGGESIGVSSLARSAPDGYTFGTFYHTAFASTPYTTNVPYRVEDLKPVIGWMMNTGLFVCRSDAPYKNLKDVIAASKTQPITSGYTGVKGSGTSTRLLYFIKQAGANLSTVPYTGDSEQMTALLGGHIQLSSCSPGGVRSLLEAEKIRALGVFYKNRLPTHPDVPSFEEQGFPNPFGYTIGLCFAPKGTPDGIVKKMHDAIKLVSENASFKEKMAKQLSIYSIYYGPKEMLEFVEMQKGITYPFLKEIGVAK